MTPTGSVNDERFDKLASERQSLEGEGAERHKMVQVGDELSGVVTKVDTIKSSYGDGSLRIIRVDPYRAVSDGVDTTGAGEIDLRCQGFELESWFDKEQPLAGDLVSIVLAELKNTGKPNPLKHYEAALQRDSGTPADPADPGIEPELPSDEGEQAEGTAVNDDIPF